jgi:acyl CoA:acetate/3-ketoacid CoA transferase beta subunit
MTLVETQPGVTVEQVRDQTSTEFAVAHQITSTP